jgi:hypothetical protein
MPRRSIRAGFILLLALGLLLSFSSVVLAQGTSATLRGRVTDASGAALPGVTVTATNDATGFNRTEVTGTDGAFRLPGLQAGTYTVLADLSGFGSVSTKSVVLNVASERELNISLKPATVKEQITVTADAPLIASEPAIGTVVSQKELQNLPLNGRQFANLGSLAPGTTLSVNSDPTKPGQLVIALNGGSGRNVNYMVDGGDNTDDTIGGALQNYNLEAVQEFKIQTMQYKAEYGRSSGGVLTVVTKTGTNDLGGSLYGFFRNKSLNSITETERLAGADKSDYKRNQYGGSIGGPIVRDRAHFFVTYEKTKRDTNYTINTGGVFPTFDGSAVPTPFEDELVTAKATANVSASQFLQVRYGYQKNTDIYGASPLTLPSALGLTLNKYRSLLGSHSWQLGGSKLNEFLYQWTRFNNSIAATSNDPSIVFQSGVTTGQNVNTPQTTNQEKSQFKDDFSWSSTIGSSRHDFKTGVNYVHEPILGGDFSTGLAGQYSLLGNDINAPVSDITIFGGFFGDSTPVDEYSVYMQDDWSTTKNLTLNLGLRYDYWTGFDLNQAANPIWQTLKNQHTYNEAYLKDFQGASDKLSNDNNNIAPRLGFTYDLKGDGRNIIRGGAGRFYDFPYTNATTLFPSASVQSNYGVVYNNHSGTGIKNSDGSLFHPGQPLPPNQLPSADIPPPNEVASPTVTNVPYSDQYSLGYSMEVNSWLGLNFEAISIHYKDIPFRFRGNPTLDASGNAQAARRFSDFGNFRIWLSGGRATYNGGNIGFHSRISSTFELQGFYTYSKASGNILGGADEFRISGADLQPDTHRLARDVSVNPLNPWCDACFGPLYSDARHRFTVSGVYNAPFGVNASGIFRYHSATPYSLVNADAAGVTHDLNGDSFFQDLAPGVGHVNTGRGHAFSQFDARLAKDFRFARNYGVELIAEAFNLFNSKNPARYDRFGHPTTYAGDISNGQQEQRLFQLGARFRF